MASGQGTNLENIHGQIREGALTGVELALVISNNSRSGAMEFAGEAGIPREHISSVACGGETEAEFFMERTLQYYQIELIALAGYMKKLPNRVVANYHGRIVNVHPSLLPKFGGHGMYGMKVHEAVLESNASESGATAHLVSEIYDEGPIVLQESCQVLKDDTPETLAQRVREIEFRLLPKAIQIVADSIRKTDQR